MGISRSGNWRRGKRSRGKEEMKVKMMMKKWMEEDNNNQKKRKKRGDEVLSQ
jgi:hypothetical protein